MLIHAKEADRGVGVLADNSTQSGQFRVNYSRTLMLTVNVKQLTTNIVHHCWHITAHVNNNNDMIVTCTLGVFGVERSTSLLHNNNG